MSVPPHLINDKNLITKSFSVFFIPALNKNLATPPLKVLKSLKNTAKDTVTHVTGMTTFIIV